MCGLVTSRRGFIGDYVAKQENEFIFVTEVCRSSCYFLNRLVSGGAAKQQTARAFCACSARLIQHRGRVFFMTND